MSEIYIKIRISVSLFTKGKKNLTPHPILEDIAILCKIFFPIYKCFYTNTLVKTSQDVFAYSFVTEHSKHFISSILRKKIAVLAVGGGGQCAMRPLIMYFFYVDPNQILTF